jgi:hypothetical protein
MALVSVLNNLIDNGSGTTFLPLGKAEKLFKNNKLIGALADKLGKNRKASVQGLWGTLGRADDKPLDWLGEVECSGEFNADSFGVTSREVGFVKEWQNMIGDRIRERFIAFERTRFGKNKGSRRLRLTLMLAEDEGALVFLHHTHQDDKFASEGYPEYILPAGDRDGDRQNYMFDVPDTEEKKIFSKGIFKQWKHRMIVRVLTFKIYGKPAKDFLMKDNAYRLLRFDNGAFKEIGGGFELDPSKKTLLLLHGTFSTTENSYKGIIGPDPETSWLTKVMRHGGKYEQIIAFDHPSIVHGPAENVAEFKKRLGPGFRFTKPVDMISTSRGGLVGKTMCIDRQLSETVMAVEKFMPIACANGVNYFKAAENIIDYLNIMRVMGMISGNMLMSLIFGALQLSAKVFVEMPGCKAMTPGSDELKAIIGTANDPRNPVNVNTRYYPVVGDYSPDPALSSPFINWVHTRIDSILGSANDWVVGTDNQLIMPPGYYANGWDPSVFLSRKVNCTHLDYLKADKAEMPQRWAWAWLHDQL